MTDDKHASSRHTTLRTSAENELRNSPFDMNSGWVLPAETLGLLYKMASDPDSAPDALKLLHELQTHQVELDLQYCQLVANEQFIKEQLSKFKSLLDVSAIGYIMTDSHGHIMEINQIATDLLNIDDKTVVGTPVSQFFQPFAQKQLDKIFKQLAAKNGGEDIFCIENPQSVTTEAKPLRINACLSYTGEVVLMTLMEHSPSKTK